MEGIARPGPIRISAHDVGSRVVIRYHLAPDDHGPYGESVTDVLGELLAWTATSMTVRRKDGASIEVPTALVVAAKVVPAGPARGSGTGAPAGSLQD